MLSNTNVNRREATYIGEMYKKMFFIIFGANIQENARYLRVLIIIENVPFVGKLHNIFINIH